MLNMREQRADRVLTALEEMGLSQMLLTDPTSIYYLTDYYVRPFERFFGLLLRADGNHALFLNRLFPARNDAYYHGWISGIGRRTLHSVQDSKPS